MQQVGRSDFSDQIQCGPILGYFGKSTDGSKWRVSVLVLSKLASQKKFKCEAASGIHYHVLAHTQSYFEQYLIQLPITNKNQKIKYQLYERKFTLRVPGNDLPIKSAFFSCNGFHSNEDEEMMGGIESMWKAYLYENAGVSPHLNLFGGDQVYFDPVWELKCFEPYFNSDLKKRMGYEFTPEMKNAVREFYETRYIEKFTKNENLAQAMSETPSINNWDDHDIFDGWGSYPKELQESPVFQGIYQIAREYYLLFQQHVDPKKVLESGAFIGKESYSTLRFAGKIAVLAVDTRSRRSKNEILPEEAWEEIFEALEKIKPGSLEYLYIMLPVPIIYADFWKFKKLIEKGGENPELVRRVVGRFRNPDLKALLLSIHGGMELEDDLGDHWRDGNHLDERRMVLTRFRKIAIEKKFRAVALSGDVHIGGVGEFRKYSLSKKDPSFIPQIISSPMGNKTGGGIMAGYLSMFNKSEKFDDETRARLVPVSRRGDPGDKRTLFSKRNWAQLQTNILTKNLTVNLYVEGKEQIKVYEYVVPRIQRIKEEELDMPRDYCNLY